MNEEIAEAWRALPNALAQHVALSACALGLALAIGLPLAAACARRARLRGPLLAMASLAQTIPGLALMALFYPLLLAISALTRSAFGFSVPALGFLPALLALTLYALLPILRNTVAGLAQVDPAAVEAAKGVGMTPLQQLAKVEAPLAAPVVMAGVRTAAVWTIGAATLATAVGQTSLGDYIFSGLQTENWISVVFGCLAAALLALVVDLLLAAIESGLRRRDRLRIAGASLALALGTAAAAANVLGAGGVAYVLGAKNFSEQYILADLMALRLRAAGATVDLRTDLGSAVAFRALAAGDIDAYVDYSGTLWTNVLRRRDNPPRRRMLQDLSRALEANYHVRVLGPLGFQNAYVFAMLASRAKALRVRTLADLAPLAPRLTLGTDLEFLERPEWRAVKAAYGLSFKATRSYDPTLMYDALKSGAADVVTAFSSDGRILSDHLAVLGDPRHALPDYDALILLSPKRAHDRRLIAALRPLIGAIDLCLMRAANLSVDRPRDKRTPEQAARKLDADLHHPKAPGACEN